MADFSMKVLEEVMQKTKRCLESRKDITDDEIRDTARGFLEEVIVSGRVDYLSVVEKKEIADQVFNSMKAGDSAAASGRQEHYGDYDQRSGAYFYREGRPSVRDGKML